MADRAFRLPRSWSNRVLEELAPCFEGDVVNVSGWKDEDKEGRRYRDYFTGAASYSVTNHVGERGLADAAHRTDFELDLVQPLADEFRGRFDVVFSHTTLEHIFRTDVAFANLCAMSRDVVVVIVPFAQEVHHQPPYGDFWRFTPMALRRMYEEQNFSVIFEAATPDKNSGIYLLFVGSRNPDRWAGRLPAWSPVETLGTWIGRLPRSLGSRAVDRLRRVLGHTPGGARAG